MILKKEFKEFRNWVLRRHGRRMLNALVDEQIMQLRIREWMQEVKGVTLPPDAFTKNLEAQNGFSDDNAGGESRGEAGGTGD